MNKPAPSRASQPRAATPAKARAPRTPPRATPPRATPARPKGDASKAGAPQGRTGTPEPPGRTGTLQTQASARVPFTKPRTRPPRASTPRASTPRAGTPRARAARRTALRDRQVFYRWLWLVYVPWLVTAFVFFVMYIGIFPSQGKPIVVALLAWNALGVGLTIVRLRRHISVPVPRTMVTGVAWLGGLGVGGMILAWMGINRISTKGGPTLVVIGAFMALVATVVPVFKLVDVTIRKTIRALLGPRRARARPQRVPQPRRAA